MTNKLYLGSAWFNEEPQTEEEKKTGKISQLRLINYLFSDIVMANTLCENLIQKGYEDCSIDELISPYDEDGEYMDEYQYFIVNLAMSEERTTKLIKLANTDLYLRYDNENDIYILSVGNLGTNRGYIMTDLELASSWEEDTTREA